MSIEIRKLLTVIAESAIERDILADIERLGAHGYTVTPARGKGSRGVRDASWDEAGNIRVEVICDDATARAIALHLRTRYFDSYGMILFMSDVEVLRRAKF